ncbi:MAG TPA: hypothetical protein VFS43_08075 [Polyangiaceae bacterium]|nr:hypothetical protein [Polyangiaceae bacterium]
MATRLDLPLDRPALPVQAAPGAKVVVRGALRSSHDGSTIDAIKTEPAPGAPAPADPGGLVDFRAGGLRVVEVGPGHEVSAVVTGEPGAACQALGVASPCLPLRLVELARARLLTAGEFAASLERLDGGMSVEAPPPPVLPPVARSPGVAPAALGFVAAALAAAGVAAFRRRQLARARSPLGRLVALAERVRGKAKGAPPELSAPLEPALAAALRYLNEGRIDPASPQGARVAQTLARVEAQLDEGGRQAREAEERHAADELLLDIESALEAADEAARLAPKARALAGRSGLRRGRRRPARPNRPSLLLESPCR